MNKVIVAPTPWGREGDTRGKFGRRGVPWALFKTKVAHFASLILRPYFVNLIHFVFALRIKQIFKGVLD